MPASKKITTRAGRVAAVAAVTVGLSAGLATAPAAAAPTPTGATLKITPVAGSFDQYTVSITGTFPMQQADAQGYLNNMGAVGGMRYWLLGSDGRTSDGLYLYFTRGLAGNNTSTSALHATPQGLRYHRSFVVNSRILNEDDGQFDGLDEVYATATFVDGDRGERTARSNQQVEYF